MLSTSILITIGLIPLCSAIPHYVHSRIDLEHLPGSVKPRYGVETITESNYFWFGSFNVGNSRNLTLLIDTGSSDVIINPGYYRRGSASVNIHKNFTNTYGSTESDGSGTGTVTGSLYNDTVSFGSFHAHQTVGSASAGASGDALIPADGIVGFAGLEESAFGGASPFFHSLCDQGLVSACRFGVILWDDGKGTQVLGALDKSLFKGELTTTSIIQEWVMWADIALNGRIIERNAIVELDTGTATIIGPLDVVIGIFNSSSIPYIVSTSSAGTTVSGYFPCDQPPTLGLVIPSRQNSTDARRDNSNSVSHNSNLFNIAPDQWAATNNGNNNCTAVLSGTDALPYSNLWVVGQRELT
ncbi:acid protease [Penicillium taxi]|uniref:acid protease n=1 Tax=Penicillium taxi TaxID=168475 RepID=UPI0025450B15|nr:acid protease [Penicillium taxi]KAJ5900153.1 acid protease [Penicillium taxi]